MQKEHERELETHNLLKIKCKEMEESLAHKEELLKEHEQMMETHNILQATNCEELLMEHKQEVLFYSFLQDQNNILMVSLAEAEEKYQNAVKNITQLEVKKSALQDKIKTLEKTVQEMGNLFFESNKKFDNLANISMPDAEEKHQNAVEIITQMEVEKSGLQDKIETLQKTVQEMGNLLIESNKECDNLTNERARELETHNLLKIKCKEMEESVAHREELLKEHEQMMETYNILQATNKDIAENLQHCEELLIISLAEAEEKHQNAVESITCLDDEKSALQDQIETLEMGILRFESNKECDNLANGVDGWQDAALVGCPCRLCLNLPLPSGNQNKFNTDPVLYPKWWIAA
ncbi:hypothetical protein C0J50_9195 [Silurus asotus]|uniref:Uncharacterized protein n=1 Tax=Silurus asotus TaxID=30991 RepID=A0AAD5FEL1_SILAS|nr:hypothetical protein C0J50_9195 [Silurus asotus]